MPGTDNVSLALAVDQLRGHHLELLDQIKVLNDRIDELENRLEAGARASLFRRVKKTIKK